MIRNLRIRFIRIAMFAVILVLFLIIGAINMIDQPLTPRSRGARSLTLYLSGVTKEMLDEEREQILETTQEDLNELADVVEDVLRQGYACTIGSEAKVREHENLFDEIVALQ